MSLVSADHTTAILASRVLALPSGLLALAALDLGLARRHAGAVEAKIESGSIGGLGFDDAAFVAGDLTPERFGVALHRLRRDGETGQFAQQGAGALEAGPGGGDADHAQRRRRQEGIFHAERAVARAEAIVTTLAVIPGALQRQGAESRGEDLGPAPGEACLAAAPARQARSPVVAMVGIEPVGDGLPHDLQCHPPGFGLDRLEVIDDTLADQPLDLGLNLLRDRRAETPLFPGVARLSASSLASHSRPLTSTRSRTSPRSRWYSAIWPRVPSMASAGMVRPRDTDIEPARFAQRIIREAERRSFDTAERRVILGDGAPWIWNFADEHFPDAIQIVDIFHAKGHLFEVAKAIYGIGSEIGGQWARKRREELDEGRVDEVIAALRSHAETCEEARKNAEYFSNNRERMNYPKFRAMGLCVASGVVEGGCKNIVGARLKQAGMRWTVDGANAIIALRCAVESNRFDDFWERRAGAIS